MDALLEKRAELSKNPFYRAVLEKIGSPQKPYADLFGQPNVYLTLQNYFCNGAAGGLIGFHATPAGNLESILEQGLLVSKTDPEHTKKVIWFAVDPKEAYNHTKARRGKNKEISIVAVDLMQLPPTGIKVFRSGGMNTIFVYYEDDVPPVMVYDVSAEFFNCYTLEQRQQLKK